MRLSDDEILYIDSKSSHEDEYNAMSIHPSKMNHLPKFEKEIFDKVIVQNSKTEYFNAVVFTSISKVLKKRGICEFYIDEPIRVMQDSDADQIKEIAKRKGFSDIKAVPYENWVKDAKGIDQKIETIKLIMIKD